MNRIFNHIIILLLFVLSLVLDANLVFAQSTVVKLVSGQKSVSSAPIDVLPPSGKGEKRNILRVGEKIVSGTRLIIPAGIEVTLQSNGGQQVCKSTNKNPIEYKVSYTQQGENHSIIGWGAELINYVTKALGYDYRVSNGRGTTASAEGTIFTFVDQTEKENKKAMISTHEGTIKITDSHPITIGNKPIESGDKRKEPLSKAVTTTQSEGDELFVSSDEPFNYESFDEAISELDDYVERSEVTDEIADYLLLLGDLYMEQEQPENAVVPYKKALQFYQENYGEYDLYTLEAQLCYAEALMANGEETAMAEQLEEAKTILTELSEYAEENLQYVDESDERYLICEELTEIYGLLGWLYLITDDQGKSNIFFGKMENGC